MASAEVTNTNSKPRNNENGTQQTITVSFVPETDSYDRPKNMEEYTRAYFESINGISKRIIAEERKIIAQNRNTWPTLSVEERDRLLNDRMIASDVRQKYNSNDEYWREQTPWQAEKLMTDEDKLSREDDKTQSLCNDSFSTPFQWATMSQRNLQFPEIKKEKINNVPVHVDRKQETARPEQRVSIPKKEQSIDKVNIAPNNIQEKQIKTKNNNIKDVTSETDILPTSKNRVEHESFETLTNNNEHVSEEGETSSGQPKPDEKQYLDGTKNIFEFLQSWDP